METERWEVEGGWDAGGLGVGFSLLFGCKVDEMVINVANHRGYTGRKVEITI